MDNELWIHLTEAFFEQKEYIFRMIGACILGGAIGFERKHRHKGAGMRTHALVCMGAALMMIVSKYGFADLPGADGARIAAQVVSGIGFLGAGVIFVRNNAVNGLTTAAGIWVTSGVGLSVGAGQWILSASATIVMICVQFLLHNIKILAKEPYRSWVKIEFTEEGNILKDIENLFQKEKITIASARIRKKNSGKTEMNIEAVFPAGYSKIKILNGLAQINQISGIDI